MQASQLNQHSFDHFVVTLSYIHLYTILSLMYNLKLTIIVHVYGVVVYVDCMVSL